MGSESSQNQTQTLRQVTEDACSDCWLVLMRKTAHTDTMNNVFGNNTMSALWQQIICKSILKQQHESVQK